MPAALLGDRAQDERLRRDGRGAAPVVARARTSRVPRHVRLGRAARAPARRVPDACRARRRTLDFDDPINIQYTSGTTGFPKGATLTHHNILNNGYFIGETLGYSEHDRVCIPVPFYHCFGMVLGNLACTTHGAAIVVPGPVFDPLATLETVEAERCTSLYGVPTMFIAELDHPDFARFDLSSLRTGIMAGSPCPVEVMKQVRLGDAHGRGDDLLRHDRDVTGLDPDRGRRPDRPARRHGRPGAPARRDQDRRPGGRTYGAARRVGRAVHARLLGDARLLERTRAHRRGDRRRRVDAHRRPRRRWTTTAT